MKLKLACADFTFPLLAQDHVFDLIAMLGLAGVDVGLFEGRSHLWPSTVLPNSASSAAALRQKLEDRGLSLADVFLQPAGDFTSLAVNHTDSRKRETARDLFLRTLEFTLRAGGRHITTLPGVPFPDEPPGDSLKRCSEELAWRVDQARLNEVTFSVEAHIGSLVPSPAEAAALVKMTPGLTL